MRCLRTIAAGMWFIRFGAPRACSLRRPNFACSDVNTAVFLSLRPVLIPRELEASDLVTNVRIGNNCYGCVRRRILLDFFVLPVPGYMYAPHDDHHIVWFWPLNLVATTCATRTRTPSTLRDGRPEDGVADDVRRGCLVHTLLPALKRDDAADTGGLTPAACLAEPLF